MKAERIVERILKEKIIAIVRGISLADMIQTAGALLEGGISSMEITFDHTSPQTIQETAASIRSIKDFFGDTVNIGAGTVLSPEEVDMAVDAGADYIISPDSNRKVIERTKALGKVSIPGALTPSEICMAYEQGADLVKLFPAGALGPDYIRAVRAPLVHIPLCAVGGILPENISGYLKAGIRCFGVGGNLVSVQAVRKRNFAQVTRAAERYRRALAGEGRE